MNIYQIKQELLAIFDELEENGGELTPELEEQLTISQEAFKSKIEDYTNVIKLLECDIQEIKLEQKRLKDFADRKQKVIDRLKSTIITAIEEFGSTKKSGVKYVEYSTGEVSIRKTKAVEVDADLMEEISNSIALIATELKQTNQLDIIESINKEHIIGYVAEQVTDDDNNVHGGYYINEDDLRHTDVELAIKVPISDLLDGQSYPILREIARKGVGMKVSASVSKTKLKKDLEINGACAPNIARLVENKSISIK